MVPSYSPRSTVCRPTRGALILPQDLYITWGQKLPNVLRMCNDVGNKAERRVTRMRRSGGHDVDEIAAQRMRTVDPGRRAVAQTVPYME